jgi:HEPN domain-containing protein
MREEVKNNLIQADKDLETATQLLNLDIYYASVFFSQQAAEKSLKALYIYQKNELPKTHNLVELTRELNAPAEIQDAARELTPDYLTTRYVNAANGIPADMYTESSAQMHLEYAKSILSWTKQLIK